MTVLGVIPCRYGAVRFPGKPLADIHGKPMMWHVYMRARRAKLLDRLVVATDDRRIEEAGRALGLEMVMTAGHHATGTDRVAECARLIEADIYVNVQGDEPLIDPDAIDTVARGILDSGPETLASNGFNDIAEPSTAIDTNVVKVVMALDGAALAYSRLPIPYPKGGAVTYRRQLGLYAFRRQGLQRFASLPQGPMEAAEGVEMLRFLEHGHRVQMVRVPNDEATPVDTPADLERIRDLVARHGMPDAG